MTREDRSGPLAVAAVTLGLVVWPIAFNLGAYRDVFYDDIFRLVVVSSILCVVTVVTRPYPPVRLILVAGALIAPLAWFAAAGYVVGSTSEAIERPGFAAWLIVIVVVSVPLTIRLLLDLFLPDLTASTDRRIIVAMVGLVVLVGVIGYATGANNPRFMKCKDFTVAGSSEPDNCAR